MRSVALTIVVTAIVVCLAAVASAAGPQAHAAHACPTFTGPGDNLIHSADFRVGNTTCAIGHKVLIHCRTDGSACHEVGTVWRCHAGTEHGLSFTERCQSGRKVAAITWLD